METLAEEGQGEIVPDEPVLEGSEEQEEQEEEGVEIVLAGEEDAPSQQQVPKGFKKRIDKLNRRNDQTSAELERERQANELLRMQLEQQKQPNRKPKLEDYGFDEAKHQQALETWEDEREAAREKRIVEQVTKALPQPKKDDNSALEAHYDRAEKLGISDYEDAEDVVIDALGKDLFKEIVGTLDKSEQVVYALSKNPSELARVVDLLQESPLKATVALGEIQGRLRLKPRKKPAPEAETEVSGSDGAGVDWAKKIAQMRNSGKYTTKQIIAEKAKARAAGAQVE